MEYVLLIILAFLVWVLYMMKKSVRELEESYKRQDMEIENESMFCRKFNTVDLSKYDTTKVTDMSGMFKEVTYIENKTDK